MPQCPKTPLQETHLKNETHVNNKREQNLLGLKFDSSRFFEGHIANLCKKANQKLHALVRIVNYMDLRKRKVLVRAFISSQFNNLSIDLDVT